MSVAAPEHGVTIPAGDPQILRAAAGRLSAAAAAMDGVAANLGASAEAACGGRRWVGPASVAFHRHVQETREAVRTGSGAFHDAATALTRLAGELQAAQEEARRAQLVAVAASGAIGSASRDLAALATSAEPDPLARSRLQRTLDDASAELTGAQAAIAHAAERARVAGRSAAAALQAATAAATVPRSPERAGACETTTQWLRRQAGDVFLDSLNPFAPEHDAYQRGRIYSDWTSGLLIGSYTGFHRYAAKNWVRYEHGFWAREPHMVRGHWRAHQAADRPGSIRTHAAVAGSAPVRCLALPSEREASGQPGARESSGGPGLWDRGSGSVGAGPGPAGLERRRARRADGGGLRGGRHRLGRWGDRGGGGRGEDRRGHRWPCWLGDPWRWHRRWRRRRRCGRRDRRWSGRQWRRPGDWLQDQRVVVLIGCIDGARDRFGRWTRPRR